MCLHVSMSLLVGRKGDEISLVIAEFERRFLKERFYLRLLWISYWYQYFSGFPSKQLLKLNTGHQNDSSNR